MSDEHWGTSLLSLWNVDGQDALSDSTESENTEVLEKAIRIASCLRDGSITEKLLVAAKLLELAPYSLTKELTDNTTETWTFDVVNGRLGSIATQVNGATIDALSTIEIQYTLEESPVAADWKRYTDGLFTGVEVDKEIRFVGLQNRVIWTPNNNEDIRVMVAL